MEYVLASASPRRKELLKFLLEDFKIICADIDETVPSGMCAFDVPEHLSVKKAEFVSEKHPDSIVIAADTVVIADDEILGKPKDEQDAFLMLKKLSGKTHFVVTGCSIAHKNKTKSFSVCSKVTFYKLSDAEIYDYISKNESLDKAGAYGIQGFGSVLVEKIEGDYFNIVGLPVAKLNRFLKEFEGEIFEKGS